MERGTSGIPSTLILLHPSPHYPFPPLFTPNHSDHLSSHPPSPLSFLSRSLQFLFFTSLTLSYTQSLTLSSLRLLLLSTLFLLQSPSLHHLHSCPPTTRAQAARTMCCQSSPPFSPSVFVLPRREEGVVGGKVAARDGTNRQDEVAAKTLQFIIMFGRR